MATSKQHDGQHGSKQAPQHDGRQEQAHNGADRATVVPAVPMRFWVVYDSKGILAVMTTEQAAKAGIRMWAGAPRSKDAGGDVWVRTADVVVTPEVVAGLLQTATGEMLPEEWEDGLGKPVLARDLL
jgi:hypothetical protein